MLAAFINIVLKARNTLLHPIERLNVSKNSSHFYSTPLPYAIGTCCEDIRHSLDAAKILGKEPVLVTLPNLGGGLKFAIAAKALFTITEKKNRYSKDRRDGINLTVCLVCMYIKIIFIVFRIIYLFLSGVAKITRQKKNECITERLNKLSFPRQLGCEQACEIISKGLKEENRMKTVLHREAKKRKLKFSQKYNKLWDDYLKKINFNIESKYIVIHTRSEHYHSDNDRREYRNASIGNYKLMIEELIENGYKVVLIGGNINEESNLRHPFLYDLRYGLMDKPCSLDVLIVAKCTKYIGMQSGPMDLAILFAKESFLVNAYTPWYCFGYPSNISYILQKHETLIDEGKTGIANLKKKGIKIIGLDEKSLDEYKLTQLNSDQLLSFCKDFVLNERNNRFNDNRWRDVTDIVVESSIYKKHFKVKRNKRSGSKSSNYRWFVNATLSHESIKIYEIRD